MRTQRKRKADSAKVFLAELAVHRGAVLTDEEYTNWRSWQLQNLAHPARIEWSIAAPGLVCMIVGGGLVATAVLKWKSAAEVSTIDRVAIGAVLIGLGSYFFFGNLHACRKEVRRPQADRIAEVDDLLRTGLITTEEHETLRRAIQS